MEDENDKIEENIQMIENKHENIELQNVLEFAVDAGRILLRHGAEIFRVEETITHICNHYGVKDLNLFVLSNGIFITAEKEGREIYAKIKHIPLAQTHLGIVDKVNDLSRKICAGEISLVDAKAQLEKIADIPSIKPHFQILAAGIGSGCFCYLLNATVADSLKSAVISMLLNIFLVFAQKAKLSRLLVNTVGAAIAAILAVALCREGGIIINSSLDKVIIGSIFTLIPGVAFVNSLRDIANSDILSGVVKMIDAILGFIYIAIGVGIVLASYNGVIGGIVL